FMHTFRCVRVRRVWRRGCWAGVVSSSCFNLFRVVFKLGGCSKVLNTRPLLNFKSIRTGLRSVLTVPTDQLRAETADVPHPTPAPKTAADRTRHCCSASARSQPHERSTPTTGPCCHLSSRPHEYVPRP